MPHGRRDFATWPQGGFSSACHFAARSLKIVDRAYMMRSGRVILDDTVEQLKARDSYWDLF